MKSLASVNFERDLLALAALPVESQTPATLSAFELELQALANQAAGLIQDTAPEPARMEGAKAPKPYLLGADKPLLADLLLEMDKFLSQSAGPDALPVSLMLEQIKTLVQLRSELPYYAELVQQYGPAGESHIKRLTSLLDDAER